MGTPLKQLSAFLSPKVLSPQVLSPHSSRFLLVSKSDRKIVGNRLVSPINQKSNSAVKKLDFSTFKENRLLSDHVKINVTDFDKGIKASTRKKDILINTPNKYDIIRNGVEDDRFLNILGKGGFGKVVRAVHKGKTVAIKIIKRSQFTLREKNALDLSHSNIVKTLDVTENQMETFAIIIMEYFPFCENLEEKLSSAGEDLGENVVLQYAKDICEGLSHCHSRGILHLDVKPRNVLVCGSVCKICDFGNSMKVSEIEIPFIHQGTIHYTAPEILLGKLPSEESDIYSFGVLLWQILERRNPYSEIDNIDTVIYMVVKCKLRPDMIEPKNELSKLYQACWNSEPSNRPSLATISEVLSKNC
ncbi:unnamed protein product [Phaedon cochleariae]|uniref:non-specific serine/threonine protein kinase n=1 Tax=Phaedon cochleariae TaxID=80249 RepID=A0A9P0DIH0_PHACE|nr:unnamed protein product [Phaedon cochleariae]